MVLAFLGTFLYACVYVLNEMFLSGPTTISPEALCYRSGLYGSLVSCVYLMFVTLPRWHELVINSIEAHGGNHSRVFILYLFLIGASYVHNKAYFNLIGSIGAGKAPLFDQLTSQFC